MASVEGGRIEAPSAVGYSQPTRGSGERSEQGGARPKTHFGIILKATERSFCML